MNARNIRIAMILGLLSVGLFCGSCQMGPRSKCVIIVKEGGKAEVKSLLLGGSASNAGWRSGNVVLFRVTQSVPAAGGATGKAGEIYQIDDQNKLLKIGDFDLKLSDDELLNKYGKDCG